jgi:SAM-dependent methyltransferase
VDDPVYDEIYVREDRHWWFRGRRAVIHALLRQAALPRPARVLDAGCGTGRNVVEFAPLGEVAGIEPSAAAVEYCRRRGLTSVVQGHVESMPFADASFDAAFAFDVLEHLDDEIVGMRELRRVTSDGGWLVATVPAYEWLWSAHDDSHHHRRRFTRPRLVAGAREAGWRPVFATYFNTVLLPPIALARAFRRGSRTADDSSDYNLTPAALDRVLGAPMQAEARLIASGARLPAGVSVGIVCTTA